MCRIGDIRLEVPRARSRGGSCRLDQGSAVGETFEIATHVDFAEAERGRFQFSTGAFRFGTRDKASSLIRNREVGLLRNFSNRRNVSRRWKDTVSRS